MLKKLTLLTLMFISLVAGSTKEWEYNNSIQLHPVAFIPMIFGMYSFEIDYTRNISRNYAFVLRPIISHYDHSVLSFGDWEGYTKEYELECAARKYFILSNNENVRFGLYPQVSIVGGYVDYFHKVLETVEKTETSYSGYTGKIFASGGLAFQVKHLFISADIGVGWGAYVPTGADDFYVEPNLAVGVTF